MIVRKLAPAEYYRAHLVQAVAFEGNSEYQKEKEEAEKQPPAADKDNWMWGAFSEDETALYGCMSIRRYRCNFEGREALMGGVGGVSTLPQYRRSGAIRACIGAALQDMYEKEFSLSFLYPFSTQYYRKFGYEVGAENRVWTVPLQDMKTMDVGGRIEQLLPGESTQPLLEIYRQFYKDYNLAAVREIYEEELEKTNLLNQQRDIYLWTDETGAARGFMICRKQREAEGVIMDCTNGFALRNGLLFLDVRALQGLLYFVKQAFSDDYEKIRFSVPGSLSVTSLVGENNTAKCQVLFNGMARVVRVEDVLSVCRCRGSGTVRIRVLDEMLPQNNAVWELTFAPGRENRVEKTEAAADVTMPINEFSALICGARGAEDIPWMPRIKLHTPQDPLEQVFYRKKCYIMDLF